MDSDYLTRVLSIADRRADLGVFGAGTLEPEYERQPSQALLARVNMLGVRTVAAERSTYDPGDHTWRARALVCGSRRSTSNTGISASSFRLLSNLVSMSHPLDSVRRLFQIDGD